MRVSRSNPGQLRLLTEHLASIIVRSEEGMANAIPPPVKTFIVGF